MSIFLFFCKSMVVVYICLSLLFFAVLVLLIFAIVLVLGPMVTGFKKAPYVPSFDSHLLTMKKYLKLKKNAMIVDLGCGDGKALRFFSKEFGLKGTGYDLNPFVIYYGNFLNRILGFKNISLIRSDFKKAKLGYYDYVYLYLWPEQLEAIEDRLFTNIGKHTVIISNSFTFINHTPLQVFSDRKGKETICLYCK